MKEFEGLLKMIGKENKKKKMVVSRITSNKSEGNERRKLNCKDRVEQNRSKWHWVDMK